MTATTWTTTHGDKVEVYAGQINVPPGSAHYSHWEFRYRVRARNGRIVETGSEGYTRRSAAAKAALRHHPRVES